MNAFQTLLQLAPEQQAAQGVEHTPREINQQPGTWTRSVDRLLEQAKPLNAFLLAAGLVGEKRATLILTGAGSSEFVGNAIAPAMGHLLNRTVLSISTTDLVTHPNVFLPDEDYVVLSFARSGNSPESVATYNLVKQLCPRARQIAITCNKDGELAQAAQRDDNACCITLPEEANDKSLVMTSSYTSMALTAAALGLLGEPQRLHDITASLARAAQRVIDEYGNTLKRFADLPFSRTCFLGSAGLKGAMQECHLKMQEMTEGQVAAMFNSFVGLRHGPQVFVNKDCAIVAALAGDPYVRQYELDMLRELKQKQQGCRTLVICDLATPAISKLADDVIELFPDGHAVPDDFRVMCDTVVGQILGVFACLRCGLKPDNPSISGTINRVVQGVTIYPYNPK